MTPPPEKGTYYAHPLPPPIVGLRVRLFLLHLEAESSTVPQSFPDGSTKDALAMNILRMCLYVPVRFKIKLYNVNTKCTVVCKYIYIYIYMLHTYP